MVVLHELIDESLENFGIELRKGGGYGRHGEGGGSGDDRDGHGTEHVGTKERLQR